MGFEMPITINKAIHEIQSNNYVLPAIQREFVWSAEQIENLFDSLLRGYPIGSFLFWKVLPDRIGDFQFYRFMDKYHERDYRHNEQTNPPLFQEVTAVLDGQQRLTALNIGLKGWYAYKLPRYWWNNNNAFPKRELYINLFRPSGDELDSNGFEISFLRDKDLDDANKQKKYWFKVSDALKFEKLQSVFNFCVSEGLTEEQDTYASDTLMELWNVLTQKNLINYFLEEEQNLDKVLNIFIRVNSGGSQLSYSDMLLSIATAAWQERDARQEIYNLVDTLNTTGDGFNFNKDYVLKSSLVLTDIQAIEFRVNNFNKENMLKIEKEWDKISDALLRTAQLISSWGYNWQTLPSTYATIPLAYYFFHLGNPPNFITSNSFQHDRNIMQHWMRVALLKRTFSGAPDNVLRSIRRAMQNTEETENFPAGSIYQELAPTPRSMRFDEPELEGLLSYHYNQSYTFTVLSMLYTWLKYDQQFHIDHIFPRSMFTRKELQKRGIPEHKWHEWFDHVNDLGNLQLLQGPVNQSKSDQEFESWLLGECETPNHLSAYKEQHCIPEIDLSFENYPQFLEARTQFMRQRLAELLNVKLSNDRE